MCDFGCEFIISVLVIVFIQCCFLIDYRLRIMRSEINHYHMVASAQRTDEYNRIQNYLILIQKKLDDIENAAENSCKF